MDPSVVPLGTGVTIESGLDPDLGKLLDANQATYGIVSGSDWHLLFIRAKKEAEAQGPWVFTLESMKAEDVGKVYDAGEASYDPPRLVDQPGFAVQHSTADEARYTPSLEFLQHPVPPPQPLEKNASFVADGIFGPAWINLRYRYYHRLVVTHLNEVGTHFYPIAYHRIVPGNPPQAQVVQVARSDWHFWPMPKTPVWSRFHEIVDFTADTTYIPVPVG